MAGKGRQHVSPVPKQYPARFRRCVMYPFPFSVFSVPSAPPPPLDVQLTRVYFMRSWEFCFSIPSSSPVSDYSRAPTSSGWTKYHLTASVIGSGSMLRSDLSDTKPVMVACEFFVPFSHLSSLRRPV